MTSFEVDDETTFDVPTDHQEECRMPLSILSLVSEHSNQNPIVTKQNSKVTKEFDENDSNDDDDDDERGFYRRLVQVEDLSDVLTSSSGGVNVRKNISSDLPRGQYEVTLRPRYLYRKKQNEELAIDGAMTVMSQNQRRSLFPKAVNNSNENNTNEKINGTSSVKLLDFEADRKEGICIFELDFDEDQDEHDFVTIDDGVVEDLSLGMKLTILGGFVIVQEVSPLKDGRASPAQISGNISRGDILVAINGKFIVGLQFIQLSESLKALSLNQYPRERQKIHLRFVVGEGNSLLDGNIRSESSSPVRKILPLADGDGNSLVDMFFPPDLQIVDQLSGLPLFGDAETTLQRKSVTNGSSSIEKSNDSQKLQDTFNDKDHHNHVENMKQKLEDDVISTSDRLQRIASHVFGMLNEDHLYGAWKSGFYDLNEEVNLLLRHEKFKQKSSIIPASNYNVVNETEGSHLSLPQRCVLGNDAFAGAGVLFDLIESSTTGMENDVLNDIQIICANDEMSTITSSSMHYDLAKEEAFYSTMLRLLEDHLRRSDDESEKKQEAYLSSIFSKARSPLPPENITAALFDIAVKQMENLNEITFLSLKSDYFINLNKEGLSHEVACESNKLISFVIGKALPMWLTTFDPVPWQERKLLFPLDKLTSNLLHDVASEVIVKQYTVSLITFYFKYIVKETHFERIAEFVKNYGAYLDLNTSLVYLSSLGRTMSKTIALLLDVASFDPMHIEAAKEYTYNGKPVLSSIVANLKDMTATEKIISLLVISFPDLMPWQVEEAVGGKQSEFYYNYLAGLFDAKRGKIAARMDGDLVATFCILSAKTGASDRRINFKNIISDRGSNVYARNLSLLLELSMTIKADDCALDVCEELISDYEDTNVIIMNSVFQNLRHVARRNLRTELETEGNSASISALKRVFRCWNNLAGLKLKKEHIMRIPAEISSLYYDVVSSESSAISFIDIISNEIPPLYALSSFQLIHSHSKAKQFNFQQHLVLPLQLILKRSIKEGNKSSESSLVLLKIEHMRQAQRDSILDDNPTDNGNKSEKTCSSVELWSKIGDGSVFIDK